ncbi:hypothetical protein [Jeotgalibacillus marinus]|uniref:YhfM-like domain-containing protein n=1 Tax=Jeotgalibacillus marinus TaxID=86667 RepID=A0ABV3Q0S1_9BACL
MKKLLLLLLFSSLCAITFIGFQIYLNKEMTLLGTITEVSISESEGYGGINDNFFVSFKKTETVSNFEDIMKSAKRKREDVNREKPDYDILVQYQDDNYHLLHLLLGNEGEESAFMYMGYEHVYYITPDATKELRQIINVED